MANLVVAMVLAVAVVWGLNHLRPLVIIFCVMAIAWIVAIDLLVQCAR